MRLTPDQRQAVAAAVKQALGPRKHFVLLVCNLREKGFDVDTITTFDSADQLATVFRGILQEMATSSPLRTLDRHKPDIDQN